MDRGVSVRFDDVAKSFVVNGETTEAIRNVSVRIDAGSFVAIVGPSGCGKSTLLLLTAGLMSLTRGAVYIGDERVSKPRIDVGFAFQRDLLLEWRSVIDNILLQPEMRRLPRSEYAGRARELLAMVGLDHVSRLYPAELSGGMRQRVALIRALVMDLPLLLLDEPFGALDAFTREQLNVDFQHLWWGLRPTVLFVTHSISEAVFLADRVIVLAGRPGEVAAVIDVDIPRPRRLAVRTTEQFGRLIRELRAIFVRDGVLVEPEYTEATS